MPSSDISALDKDAPFTKLPSSPSLAVVHLAFLSGHDFGERRYLTAPLLYFCSSTQILSTNAEIPCNSGFTSATARDFAMVPH